MLNIYVSDIVIELVEIKARGFRADGGHGCPAPQRLRYPIVPGIAGEPDVSVAAGLVFDDVYIASRVDRQVIRAGQRCAHSRAGRLIDRIATREEFYLIGSEIEGVNFVRCRGRNKYHLIAVGQRFNFHILGPLVVGSVHRVGR